jgi:hypothetical protein
VERVYFLHQDLYFLIHDYGLDKLRAEIIFIAITLIQLNKESYKIKH